MDLATAVAAWEAVEGRLLIARASLLQLQAAAQRTGGSLSQAAVDDYNRQRSKAAQNVVYYVSRIQEEVRAIPLIGEGLANRLGDTNAWGAAFLQRVPPLRFQPANGGFGVLPAAAWSLAQLTVILGGTAAVLYLSAKLLHQFNDQAVASEAEAARLAAWADGQAQMITAMAAAGVSPEQINAKINATPPPAPDAPWGAGKLLAVAAAAAGVLGGIYLITRRPARA